jgi:prophage regulatory protein
MPVDHLHLLRDVLHITKLSKSGLYRLIAAGDFPRPIKIESKSRWSDLDVQAWIAKKREESRNESNNCNAA